MALDAETQTNVNIADVPTTTLDMESAAKWKHGQKIYGTHAKENIAMKNYRKDINKAWGKEGKYKSIYIDTLLPKPIADRLKNGDM